MHQRLVDARFILRKVMPFLSHALWSLTFVEVPGMAEMVQAQSGGTMSAYISCDKYWRVYYDPQEIEKADIHELAFSLYHELGHLLRKHGERCEQLKYDPMLYNIASDLSINGDAENIEFESRGRLKLGKSLLPKHFNLPNGKSAEWYYGQLLEEAKKSQGSVDGSNQTSQGQGNDRQVQEGGGKPSSGHGPKHGRCGGCAGNPYPWEKNDSPSASDRVPEGLTPAEARIVAVQVAYAVKQQGNAPAGWKRWADEIIEPPRVDPHELFKHTVMSRLGQIAGKLDYTYAYPSRRQFVVPKVVLPGMYAPQIRLAVVIDTSGSVSNKELAIEMAFVRDVAKQVFVHETYVYSCDVHANLAGKVFGASDIRKLDIRGGGGTSMRNGVLAALECKPSLVICLTDGYTDWPALHELKGTPVIWSLIGPNPPRPPQELGDVILLTEGEKAA